MTCPERAKRRLEYRYVTMDQLVILRYLMKQKVDRAEEYFVTHLNLQFSQVSP